MTLFGTNDKLALELFVVAVGAVIGALLGHPRSPALQPGGRSGSPPSASSASWPPSATRWPTPRSWPRSAAVSVGLALWLLGWFLGPRPAGTAGGVAAAMPDWSRRSFLLRTRRGRCRRAHRRDRRAAAPRAPARRPRRRRRGHPARVRDRSRPWPSARTSPASVPDLTPIVMPNERFYRIDTALLTPSVDTSVWTLRIHGLVDREITPDLGRADRACRCSSST